MKRKGSFSNIKLEKNQQNFKNLKSLKIGVVRGYTNTTSFDNADYLKKYIAGSDFENIKKLYYGRVDMIFIDRFVGQYILKNELQKVYPDISSKLEFINPAIKERGFYLCISKKVFNNKKLTNDFQRGLKKIKDSGEFSKIIDSYSTSLKNLLNKPLWLADVLHLQHD